MPIRAPRAFFLRVLCVLGGFLFLAGCQQQPAEYRTQFLALGTLVEVQIAGLPRARAEQAAEAVRRDMQAFTARWRPAGDSELARINAALAAGETVTLDPEGARMLREARRLSRLSGGRFNPAIYRLIRLWGFDSGEPAGPPPAPADIAERVAARPSMDDLRLQGLRLGTRNPAVQLDFGASAKGVAVDRAIRILRGQGVENAIVNAGGDLRAIGRFIGPAGTRDWRIGIRHPRRHGDVLASVEIAGDLAVFTSGDYERYYEYQGRRYHHILDPATGYPARGLSSVTVLHRDAVLADAASTALFVAGPDDWPAVARAMGLQQVMVVRTDGGVALTPAMLERLSFPEEPGPTLEVITP